jgi:beta-galactosidase GanA
VAYTPAAGFPDLATIRVEIGVPATVLTDEQLEVIAGSEQDNVTSSYEWSDPDLPDRLYQVFLRSVARTIASRGLPLGMVGTDSEYGVARLTTRDSEIVRLGGQYRKRTFA